MSIENISTKSDRMSRYQKITDVATLHKLLVDRDLQINLLEEDLANLRESLLLAQSELRNAETTISIPIDWGLTGFEHRMLYILLSNAGRVMTKSVLMDMLYTHDNDVADTKILDVYACKIRKKLTTRGVGLEVNTVWGRGWTIPKESAAVWMKAETIRRTAHDIESAIQMIADSFGYTVAVEASTPTTEPEVLQDG